MESLEFIDKFLSHNAELYMKKVITEDQGDEKQKMYKKFLAKEILGCTGNAIARKESTFANSVAEMHKNNYYLSKFVMLCR